MRPDRGLPGDQMIQGEAERRDRAPEQRLLDGGPVVGRQNRPESEWSLNRRMPNHQTDVVEDEGSTQRIQMRKDGQRQEKNKAHPEALLLGEDGKAGSGACDGGGRFRR